VSHQLTGLVRAITLHKVPEIVANSKKLTKFFLNLDCQSDYLTISQRSGAVIGRRAPTLPQPTAMQRCPEFATAFLHIPVVVLGRWQNILSIDLRLTMLMEKKTEA